MAKKGFTIVEGMVVLIIMFFIGGAIMAFYPTSARLFQRGAAESQAEAACQQAVRQMASAVREAMDCQVIGTGEAQLEVTSPLKETDATTGLQLVVYPLTPGDRFAFYRSNSSGSRDTVGDYFWQAQYIGGAWQPIEVLARGVTSFTCPTVNTDLPPKGVEVMVISQQKQGPRTATISRRQYLECRNSQPPS